MRVQLVGRGRVGAALAHALAGSDLEVLPLAGRGADGVGPDGRPVDVVLLAVPDAAIAEAAALVVAGPVVGHCSGATGLEVLRPHAAFSLHPLLTVLGAGTSFSGAHAAIDASDEGALAVAQRVAGALGLRTFRVRGADRAAYHAAASIASNFLVALEGFAEELAAGAGVPRDALRPLAEAALRNWGERGAAAALTGPIARGDEGTVQRQRAAVAERMADRLPLFDALAAETRRLASAPAIRHPEVPAQHEPEIASPNAALPADKETPA
ncbi:MULTISPECIES: DUF2520 domain-containing protein [unclassified Leucobacter]|uniref:DUF2520 domain-containing protein n=1 Tax=unclassified Leucobacter TaxID=2621730 RepID=UPI003016A270